MRISGGIAATAPLPSHHVIALYRIRHGRRGLHRLRGRPEADRGDVVARRHRGPADLRGEPRFARAGAAATAIAWPRSTSATRRRCVRCSRSTGRPRCCTSRPSRTSTARSTGRPSSSGRTSSARTRCWMRRTATGARCRRAERDRFRFLHVSTDEVFGSLGLAASFTEETPYRPNSPVLGDARPAPTISCGRGITRTGCRPSRPTARTTTGRISSRRS